MSKINEYAEEVAKYVRELIPNAMISVSEVLKNNGVLYHGIAVKFDGSNIAPSIYIDSWYKTNIKPEKAAMMIKEILDNDVTAKEMDVSWMKDFENIKPKLRAKLINESNKEEVFRSAKGYGFDDLIIVPYIMVDVDDKTGGSVTLNNKILDMLGVNADEVIDIALANCESEVKEESIMDTMARMHHCEPEDFGFPNPNLIVISSSRNESMWGAISILCKIDELKKRFDKFYVIPSSVNETIVAEATGMDGEAEYIKFMISDVNKSCVEPEERLSNTLYYFGE